VRILVAGAGYVGVELARGLARAGHDVLALRRSPPSAGAASGAPLRWLACDLGDSRALAALALEGVDALAYLVAADARDDAAYRRAYLDGLASLLSRLRAASSLRRVLEGETVARGAGCESVALRLGGIYGPGRDSLIQRVRSGTARLPRAPHYTNRIQRDDAARACAYLLALPSPAACYVGVDEQPADQADVLRWLAARLGTPAPPGDYDPNAAPSGKRCSSARLRASGFSFMHPGFREGYAALLA